MTRIRFVQRDGWECEVELASGATVMLATVRNGVGGIEGACEGCLDCATCHV